MNSTGLNDLNQPNSVHAIFVFIPDGCKVKYSKKNKKVKSLPSCKHAHKTRPDLVILHSDCQTSPQTLLKCSQLLRRRVLTWIYVQNPILFFLKENSRCTESPEEKLNCCARGQRTYANHHFLLWAAKWPICGPLSGRNMDFRLKKGIN